MTAGSTMLALGLLVAGCDREPAAAPGPAAGSAVTPGPSAGGDDDRVAPARAAIAALKQRLLQALTAALPAGPASAVEACHTTAPALTAAPAAGGIVVGRATRKPRNPNNRATGWQLEAVAHFEAELAAGRPLAGASFRRPLDDGRLGYAEPLLIAELCLPCHGRAVDSPTQAAIALHYPLDQATGYQVGDLRGVAWAELPP